MKKLYKCQKPLGLMKAGEQYELDETDALALVESGHIEAVAAHDIDTMVAEVLNRLEKSVADTVKTQVGDSLDSALKSTSKGKGPRIDVLADEADTSKSLGDWMRCVGLIGSHQTPIPIREQARERLEKAYGSDFSRWNLKGPLAEGSGVTGGYTAPPEYSTELLKLAIEDTILASRARMIPMGSAEIHIPMLDQTSVLAAGQTSYTGGMIAYWTGEAATRSETEPKFKQVTLRANELSGYTVASRSLLQDNVVALESLIGDLIKETVNWYLDYAMLQGDGVGKPLGVLNASATIPVTRKTAGQVNLQDAAKLIGALLPASRKSAVWIMAQDSYQQIVQLSDNSGRVVFLPNYAGGGVGPATVSPDANMYLLGRPVFFTEKLPALGTKGDVMLVDPRYYLFGNRVGLEVAASEHYKFINNQMTWRFVMRADGQPWLDKAFTLQDGTRQISPYVVLN
jgi:HK97 family phage major capsid protein